MENKKPEELRIVVTGAGGRLARLLVPDLRRKFSKVHCISRQSEDGALDWVAGLDEALGEADVLVHMAWSTVPLTSHLGGEPVGVEDMRLCSRIMAAPAARNLRQIIFFSSASVYGETRGREVVETTPHNPTSLYGATKCHVEHLFRILGREMGLEPCILRITNPYGFLYATSRPQGLIARAIECILSGHPIDVWGDGRLPKDYLHMQDLSDALVAAIARNLTGAYNVSNGESHEALEVFATLEALSGRTLARRFVPSFPWDCGMGAFSYGKLEEACGWRPRIGLEGGLNDAYHRALELRDPLGDGVRQNTPV